MDIKFTKMQAYGNDYIYIDAERNTIENPNTLSVKMSDRHFGVGSDGIVLICPSEKGDFRMRMFNPDGTEGEMCGNALRSVSKFVYHYGMTEKKELWIETLGGMQHVWLDVTDNEVVNITADIGEPRMDTGIIPVNTELPEFIDQPVAILDMVFNITAVSWGNPHCVMFIDDTSSFDVAKYGPAIEHYTELFPNKTNVTFAQVIAPNYIKIREWERGTGETIGCGTGCCTAAVAAARLGMTKRRVQVEQKGGILEVEWKDNGHVFMKGPSHIVYEGVYHCEA